MLTTPAADESAERSEYSISELAREFDVTARAIRIYETAGLLAPRRAGQRRIYSPRDRTRLKLTLRGKRLGLALAEIREIVDMYDSGGDERPQLEKFLAALQAHRQQLEQKREDIDAQLPRSPCSRSAAASASPRRRGQRAGRSRAASAAPADRASTAPT